MLTTTALFSEYLAVGAAAWIWLLPLVLATKELTLADLIPTDGASDFTRVGILVFTTYIAGVLTESLSFILEKIVVGRTSKPRSWVDKRMGSLSHDDWLRAQSFIWASEGAFKEFVYSRLRVTISRGVATNGLLALGGLPLIRAFGPVEFLPLLLGAAAFMSFLGAVSWYSATAEYRARVKIAGQLEPPQ